MPKISTYSPESDTGKVLRNLVLNKRSTISSAEILELNSSPKLLIAAPGAGKMIAIQNFMAGLAFNTVAYTVPSAVNLNYGDVSEAGTTIAEIMIVDQDSADRIQLAAVADINFAVPTVYEDKAVYLYSNTDPTDGDSTLTIDMQYRIIDLP